MLRNNSDSEKEDVMKELVSRLFKEIEEEKKKETFSKKESKKKPREEQSKAGLTL